MKPELVPRIVGERLREAMSIQRPRTDELGRQRPFSVAHLHDDLTVEESPDLRGTGVRAVTKYVKGEAAPPLDVLVAMARVLGVRAEWLAGGEGYPFDDGLFLTERPIYAIRGAAFSPAGRARGEQDVPPLDVLAEEQRAFRAAFTPRAKDYWQMSQTVQALFCNLLARFFEAIRNGDVQDASGEDVEDAGTRGRLSGALFSDCVALALDSSHAPTPQAKKDGREWTDSMIRSIGNHMVQYRTGPETRR